MKTFPVKQRGLGALTIIIFLVLLGLLGVYMNSMTTLSSLNTSASAGAMQAWFAARSGAEWGIYQALNRPACTCGSNCCAAGTAISGATINFSGGGTNNYSASLDCSETSLNEGGTNYCVYDIGVTATFGNPGDVTFARRRLEVTITDKSAPP